MSIKHCRPTYQSHQIFTALILTGILSLGASMTLTDSATANSVKTPQAVTNLKQSRNNRLPNSVINAIRSDINRNSNTRIPQGQLKVVSFSQQSWPNSCLGLPQPDEACAEIFIENGWRVVMSNGRQTWNYRSDNTGRIVRLESQESSGNSGNPGSSSLPSTVADAILQAASQQTGLPTSGLRIIKSEQITTDGCLGLGGPAEACLQIAMQAWEVTVEAGQQRLVYRSDSKGDQVRLNKDASNIGSTNLPQRAADAILRTASERTGLRTSQLRIVKSAQLTTDGCLGLPRPGEACTRIAMQAWEVTIEGGQQRLVYRSDMNGSRIRLNEAASTIGTSGNLPKTVANTVLQLASQQLGVPASQLRVTQAEKQTWTDGCLGLPSPVERCMSVLTPGWRVVVQGRQQSQVYRTDETAERIRAEGLNGQSPNTEALPATVTKAVLQDAQTRSRLPLSQLRIVQAELVEWSDGCLGLAEPEQFCTQAIVPGWKVTVVGGQQTFVYRSDEAGSLVKYEGAASQGNSGAIPIPKSELPPPLPKNTIFRAIASGGITGRTYETRLMEDGRLIQVLIDSTSTTAQPDIRQIPRQQVRQFQQLLEKQPLYRFNQLSYPAPRGAADYITLTISSQAGTVRYADMVQGQLPEPWQVILQAWNQIASSR